jgi:hypothetical protein
MPVGPASASPATTKSTLNRMSSTPVLRIFITSPVILFYAKVSAEISV